MWVVETELERLEGGACLGSPYQPPVATEPAGTVRFEFTQRNFGRFAVNSGDFQPMMPLTFGVAGFAEFLPATDYIVPVLEGEWSVTLTRDGERSLFATRLEAFRLDYD